jgi:hypothetical protein
MVTQTITTCTCADGAQRAVTAVSCKGAVLGIAATADRRAARLGSIGPPRAALSRSG